MFIYRWIAILSLTSVLHLQAQTASPEPKPNVGTPAPTLNDSIKFINEAFKRQANIRYLYAAQVSTGGHSKEMLYTINDQTVAMTSPCVITFSDSEQDDVRKENPIKLSELDPRKIHPITITDRMESDGIRKYWTSREVFIVTFGPTQLNSPVLGYFTDKELANSVSKAYIHAIVLCGGRADQF